MWKKIAPFNEVNVKRSSSRCFRGYNLHPRVTICVHFKLYLFFPSDKSFKMLFFRLKRTTWELLLCNEKYRSPCSLKRKRAFVSLSSLAYGKLLTLCSCTRSFARANDAKIVRSRGASVLIARSNMTQVTLSRNEITSSLERR